MSDTEAHTGKLVPMVLSGVTLEERCEDACKKLGYKMSDFHSSYEECLRDDGYREVYVHDEVIYKIEDTELDPFGFSVADQNEDGSINYTVMYYNGGASMDEVIDEAVKRMFNDD